MELFLGLITGFAFGFLLQKSQVLRFEKQVGFMLLKDMTIIKFMASAEPRGTLLSIYLLIPYLLLLHFTNATLSKT